jgi:ribosome recycling factor
MNDTQDQPSAAPEAGVEPPTDDQRALVKAAKANLKQAKSDVKSAKKAASEAKKQVKALKKSKARK